MRSLAMLLALFLVSCQVKQADQPTALKVILDTDMGSDCDDVGALALLHEYANQGRVEIMAVIYSSGAIPYGAGVIDAINRYYGRSSIPIGANYETMVGDKVDKMQAEKLAKDTAAFGHAIQLNSDAVEQAQLLRDVLAKAPDHSIVYITIGHTKGLYDLLVSGPDSLSNLTGYELVNSKIDKWVALGALRALNKSGHYTKDWNFFFNGTAEYTKYLVDHFPRPSFFVSAGSTILTGKSLIGTPSGNIVRTAYRDWLWNVEKKTLEDQRPSWDLMAVLYAVEAPEEYFDVYSQGYLDFDIARGCRWFSRDSTNYHHYVLERPGHEEEIANYLNDLISILP